MRNILQLFLAGFVTIGIQAQNPKNDNLIKQLPDIRYASTEDQELTKSTFCREVFKKRNEFIKLHSQYHNNAKNEGNNKWYYLLSWQNYNWDIETESWTNQARLVEITYNEYHQAQLFLYQRWDTLSGIWINSTQITYTYNEQGYYTELLAELWNNDNGEWENSWKDIYARDENGRITDLVWLIWDKENLDWIKYHRESYSFYEDGKLKEKIEYVWDCNNNEWAIGSYKKYHSVYMDIWLEYIHRYWDYVNCSFYGGSRSIYTYNEAGNQTLHVYQKWDTTSYDWLNYYRVLQTYNEYELRTEIVNQDWNVTNNEWENYNRNLETYDEMNYLVEDQHHYWLNNQWNIEHRYIFDYNEYGNLLESIYQYWAWGEWNNHDREYYFYTDTLLNQKIYYTSSGINEWSVTERDTISYDNARRPVVFLNQSSDNTNWENNLRILYNYTNSGDEYGTEEINQYWYEGAWVNDEKTYLDEMDDGFSYLYEYQKYEWNEEWILKRGTKEYNLKNKYGNTIESSYQSYNYSNSSWYGNKRNYVYDEYLNKIEQLTETNSGTLDEWTNSSKKVYTYIWFYDAVNEPENEKLYCILKNPYTINEPILFTSHSNTGNYNLMLYDISGKEVFRLTFTTGETIYINKSLVSGFYLMRISDGQNMLLNKKIIIQN